jgi:hypothetical protein
MTFEELQEQIEKDLSFDETQLDTESLRIPQLHNKYLKHLYSEKLMLKKLRNDMGELTRIKNEYYTGKLDETTLKERGWEPFQLRVLKNDVDMYLEGDKDMNRLKGRIQLQEERVDYIESTVKAIANRGWLIRNAIDWKKFLGGV